MKLAVISDIHGNLEALNRVFKDIESIAVDNIVCLGDIIGYGPQPDDVVKEIKKRKIPSVMGNHEQALFKHRQRTWFNPAARSQMAITQKLLSGDSLAYLLKLPLKLIKHGCCFVHGAPPDSAIRYLFSLSDTELNELFTSFEQQTCFVGHTHELVLAIKKGDKASRVFLRQGVMTLSPDYRYIVNAGSVGQPRDGDNRAKYVVWEPETMRLEVRCVEYDIKATSDRILALGFPERYAKRLW